LTTTVDSGGIVLDELNHLDSKTVI